MGPVVRVRGSEQITPFGAPAITLRQTSSPVHNGGGSVRESRPQLLASSDRGPNPAKSLFVSFDRTWPLLEHAGRGQDFRTG